MVEVSEPRIKPSERFDVDPQEAHGSMFFGAPMMSYSKEELACALVHYGKAVRRLRRAMARYPERDDE